MKHPDWHLLRAFHATARAGSLSGAARALGLTQPTLSRQIADLERQMGMTLFSRSGRRLVLSEAGASLLPHVEVMETAAADLALAAAGRQDLPEGPVTLSLTDIYATHVLPPIAARLHKAAPKITLHLDVTDAASDLHRQEADLALRHGPRPDRPGLMARHLRDSNARVYASTDWIACHGLPADAVALGRAGLLAPAPAAAFADHMAGAGIPVAPETLRLVGDSGVAMWALACAGLGPAVMLDEVAALFPDMRPLAPSLPPIRVPLWLVAHQQTASTARIRTVATALTDALQMTCRD